LRTSILDKNRETRGKGAGLKGFKTGGGGKRGTFTRLKKRGRVKKRDKGGDSLSEKQTVRFQRGGGETGGIHFPGQVGKKNVRLSKLP